MDVLTATEASVAALNALAPLSPAIVGAVFAGVVGSALGIVIGGALAEGRYAAGSRERTRAEPAGSAPEAPAVARHMPQRAAPAAVPSSGRTIQPAPGEVDHTGLIQDLRPFAAWLRRNGYRRPLPYRRLLTLLTAEYAVMLDASVDTHPHRVAALLREAGFEPGHIRSRKRCGREKKEKSYCPPHPSVLAQHDLFAARAAA
jgi:hypothetical protein